MIQQVDLFPHKIYDIERHADDIEEEMPITGLDISRCERILGSISHDRCIKFYDLTDLQLLEHKKEKKSDFDDL